MLLLQVLDIIQKSGRYIRIPAAQLKEKRIKAKFSSSSSSCRWLVQYVLYVHAGYKLHLSLVFSLHPPYISDSFPKKRSISFLFYKSLVTVTHTVKGAAPSQSNTKFIIIILAMMCNSQLIAISASMTILYSNMTLLYIYILNVCRRGLQTRTMPYDTTAQTWWQARGD